MAFPKLPLVNPKTNTISPHPNSHCCWLLSRGRTFGNIYRGRLRSTYCYWEQGTARPLWAARRIWQRLILCVFLPCGLGRMRSRGKRTKLSIGKWRLEVPCWFWISILFGRNNPEKGRAGCHITMSFPKNKKWTIKTLMKPYNWFQGNGDATFKYKNQH